MSAENAKSERVTDSGRPSDARRRLAKFCDEYEQMGGIDPENVYTLHLGHPKECSVRISDLRSLLDAADAVSEPTPRQDEFVENPWRNECSVCGAVDGGWCTADGGERLTGIHRARLGAAPEPLTPPRDATSETERLTESTPREES